MSRRSSFDLGISAQDGSRSDVRRSKKPQHPRRTAARTSENVASAFGYQAAARIGSGSNPVWYQTAVPLAISRSRSDPSYQRTATGDQAVVGSVRTTALVKAESENVANQQSASVTLLAAAGQAGDRKLLDATAEQFIGQYEKDSPKFSGILAKLREAIAKDDPDALDREGIDALIKATPRGSRSGPALVVASYLAGCDRSDQAKPYWEQAADKSEYYFWWRLIAADKLRQHSP